jgi:ubiquinone/menaquinone biosynthesis C-methylase UbiE
MSDPNGSFSDGAGYERLMGRWSKLVGGQFLDWLAAPAGLRWLDAGCGNGAFTEEIMARCAPSAVTGIDPSEAQIAYARQRPGTSGAQYQVADARALPFADSSFDVAAMALAISFVPEPSRAVKEMARTVRPGGQAATYMWDIPAGGVPLAPLYAVMRDMGLPAQRPPSFEASRREALHQLWQEAGFQAVETAVFRVTVSFDDFEDFWRSNTVPVGPQAQSIHALSDATREELRRRLRATLPTAADGRIAYEAFANAVKGLRAA